MRNQSQPEKDSHASVAGEVGLNPVPTETVLATRLNQVRPRAVEWLWPARLPLGKVTVLDGDPGLGKSTVLLDLAARLSRGAALPDGAPGLHADVTLLTGEDGLEDTVYPRLKAAGADLARVHALQAIRDASGEDSRPPAIPSDLPLIEELLRQNDSRLLIVDPFMAFLDRSVNAASDPDVRRCLHRLAQLAERRRCAVVLLRHLTKKGGSKALYRGGGSIGIIGAARSALLVVKDPEQEGGRVLAVIKSNLATPPASLRYRLEVTRENVCRVVWCGSSSLDADDLLGLQDTPREKSAVRAAMDFLGEYLKNGPQAAHDCLAEARRQQIREKTLRRAKERLGVVSTPLRFADGSIFCFTWALPPRSGEARKIDHLD